MSESDIQRICERLESLEKHNHKIKVVSILLFSVVLIGLLIWAIPNGAQKVQARQTRKSRYDPKDLSWLTRMATVEQDL